MESGRRAAACSMPFCRFTPHYEKLSITHELYEMSER